MAKEKAVKTFSKVAIVSSEKYRGYCVLRELLEDDKKYSIEDVEKVLKKFKKEVTA